MITEQFMTGPARRLSMILGGINKNNKLIDMI